MKSKTLALGYTKILVLFLVGILCISTVSHAVAATQSELTSAYAKGYESGKSNSNCSTAGSHDDKNNKSPDPGYAADQIRLNVEKPYLSTHVLYPNWYNGFLAGCSEEYNEGFGSFSKSMGEQFGKLSYVTCNSKGLRDAASGNEPFFLEFSKSLAQQSPEANLPYKEQREAFIEGFHSSCWTAYIDGLTEDEEKADEDIIGSVQKDIDKLFGDTEKKVTGALKENAEKVGEEIGKSMADQLVPDFSSGGCLIATATYGSELSPQVQQLRELRDNTLLQTESGSAFMTGFNQFYYSFSPTIADWERQNSIFKEAVKLFITPLIASLSILNYVDMDSEAEVLGYGISLIILNVGMYIAAPVGIGLFAVSRKSE